MKDEILKRYRDGEKVAAIALKLNVSKYAVRKHIKKAGLPFAKNPGNTRYSEDFKKEVANLYHEGWSFSKISSKYHVSADVIKNALAQEGIKVRKTWSKFFTTKNAIENIKIRFLSNGSLTGLGKEFGGSRDAIYHALKMSGLSDEDILGNVSFIYENKDGKHFMRSKYEVSFAKILDETGLKWIYEKENISDGEVSIRPDFWLYDQQDKLRYFVEVKGASCSLGGSKNGRNSKRYFMYQRIAGSVYPDVPFLIVNPSVFDLVALGIKHSLLR